MTYKLAICSLIITAGSALGGTRIQVREGRPIVDGVYVNGHGPYRFLVDTGANVNLMTAALADKIGMKATSQVDLASASGRTASLISEGNEVALDSVSAKGQRFLLTGLEQIQKQIPDVQGVLGQWFLFQFDYTIDLKGKQIDFGKRERKGTRIWFKMVNARPVVSTSLGDLALDSGAGRLVLFGVRADVGAARGELRTVTGAEQVGLVTGRSLLIEGRKFWGGGAVAIPSRTESGVDGLMPLSLFSLIYVCNSEGYVVFD